MASGSLDHGSAHGRSSRTGRRGRILPMCASGSTTTSSDAQIRDQSPSGRSASCRQGRNCLNKPGSTPAVLALLPAFSGTTRQVARLSGSVPRALVIDALEDAGLLKKEASNGQWTSQRRNRDSQGKRRLRAAFALPRLPSPSLWQIVEPFLGVFVALVRRFPIPLARLAQVSRHAFP